MNSWNTGLCWLYSFFLYWFYPYVSQSSHIILFSNFQKIWSNLHLCRRGPIKLVLFICQSVCLSVCDHFSQDLLSWFSYFFAWGYYARYTKKWQSQILKNCICCLDNWVNQTNLGQKQNIWHFNEGNITFVLWVIPYNWLIWFCKNCMSSKNLPQVISQNALHQSYCRIF